MKENKEKKGAIEIDQLIGWLIVLGVLIIAVIAYVIISGKGSSIVNWIENLFRFGR